MKLKAFTLTVALVSVALFGLAWMFALGVLAEIFSAPQLALSYVDSTMTMLVFSILSDAKLDLKD